MERIELKISTNLLNWLRGNAAAKGLRLNDNIDMILLQYKDRVLRESDSNFPRQKIKFLNIEV